jgi:hypothetical protein
MSISPATLFNGLAKNAVTDTVNAAKNNVSSAKNAASNELGISNAMANATNVLGKSKEGLSNAMANATNELDKSKEGLSNAMANATNELDKSKEGLSNAMANATNVLGKSTENAMANATNVLDKSKEGLSNAMANATNVLGKSTENAMANAQNQMMSQINGKIDSIAPAAGIIGKVKAANKIFENIKNIDFKTPLTEEDKFRAELLIFSTKPEFQKYFSQRVSQILVSEFYKLLSELGELSITYTQLLRQNQGVNDENDKNDDEHDENYSEFFTEPPIDININQPCNNVVVVDKYKLVTNEKIKDFFKNAMILYFELVKEEFTKLGKVIKKYNKLKNKLLKKQKDILDPEDKKEAEEQIKQIKQQFDITHISGGFGQERYKLNTPIIEHVKNLDTFFYNILLRILINNNVEFLKCLRIKLSIILNKVLDKLYEILPLCTIKTPTKSAVISEQGVADCAFEMHNDVKSATREKLDSNIQNYTYSDKDNQIIKLTEKMFCITDFDLQPFRSIVELSLAKKHNQIDVLKAAQAKATLDTATKTTVATAAAWPNKIELEKHHQSITITRVDGTTQELKIGDCIKINNVKVKIVDFSIEFYHYINKYIVKGIVYKKLDNSKKQFVISLSPFLNSTNNNENWKDVNKIDCDAKDEKIKPKVLGGKKTTRKSSSRVSQKTRRHRQTSR